jgi:hypothetical protein
MGGGERVVQNVAEDSSGQLDDGAYPVLRLRAMIGDDIYPNGRSTFNKNCV